VFRTLPITRKSEAFFFWLHYGEFYQYHNHAVGRSDVILIIKI
jgi:hypothetical protein